MSETTTKSEVPGDFPIWKSTNGSFSNREWAKRPPNGRFQVISYLKIDQWSMIDMKTLSFGLSSSRKDMKHFCPRLSMSRKTRKQYRYTVIRECMVYTCTWKDEHVVFGKRHASQNNFAVLAFIPKSWQAGPDFCFQLVTSRISVIWCFVQYSRWANFVW